MVKIHRETDGGSDFFHVIGSGSAFPFPPNPDSFVPKGLRFDGPWHIAYFNGYLSEEYILDKDCSHRIVVVPDGRVFLKSVQKNGSVEWSWREV